MNTILQAFGLIEAGNVGDLTYSLYKRSNWLLAFNIISFFTFVLICKGRVGIFMLIPLCIYWCISLAYMLEKIIVAEKAAEVKFPKKTSTTISVPSSPSKPELDILF